MMFPGLRQITLLLIAGLSATLLASARPGYLASIGPVPLRFVPPAPRVKRTPLVETNKVAEPTPATNAVVTPPVTTNTTTEVPMPDMQTPGAVTNSISTPASPLRPDDVISPQMLLKYFNRSTNGPPGEIITPINVTPSRPAETPSSKATYSN